ncbi:MAG: alpha/beta fold hydrolase [Alphaproteobacteria bacterium]|jgi:lipase
MRPAPTEHVFQTRHATLAYHDWAGEPEAPAVFLVHATGFHARVWDQIILKLPKAWRVIAMDSRGHGRSPDCAPLKDWLEGAGDTIDLIDGLGIQFAMAAGHSMGGYAITATAIERPDAFRSMVLVDPVLLSPIALTTDRMGAIKTIEDHPVAKRRNGWPDWQAFHEQFRARLPYSKWQPQILEDYCRHGVQPNPSGEGVLLACPPMVEASVYFNSQWANLMDGLPGVQVPTTVLRAKHTPFTPGERFDYMNSPTWDGLAAHMGNATDVYLPHLSHFIPMEDPDLVAKHLIQAVEA